MPDSIEWSRTPWVPERWFGIDQPPIFLESFDAGDEVLSLESDDSTFFAFFARLVSSMCESAQSASLNLELPAASLDGSVVEIVEALAAGGGTKDADGRWSLSLGCDHRLADWLTTLFDTHLDYQFTFSGARVVERDGAIVLVAGSSIDISAVQALVESLSAAAGIELKPVGWDIERCPASPAHA